MTPIIILAIVLAVAFVVLTVTSSVVYRLMPENNSCMEGIIGRLEQQTSSILDTTRTILEDAEPKINEITNNVAETKAAVQAGVAQAEEAWGEILNRARRAGHPTPCIGQQDHIKGTGNDLRHRFQRDSPWMPGKRCSRPEISCPHLSAILGMQEQTFRAGMLLIIGRSTKIKRRFFLMR